MCDRLSRAVTDGHELYFELDRAIVDRVWSMWDGEDVNVEFLVLRTRKRKISYLFNGSNDSVRIASCGK